MSFDKLILLKKIIESKLSSIDFDKEIEKNQEQLSKILDTPADEYSFEGNIEYGITNILDSATAVTHPIGFLTAKKSSYKEFLELFDKDITELETILNPPPREEDTSWKEDLLEKLDNMEKSTVKHFYDCKLTNEDWGSENCICPGAYVYRKYLSVGLTKEDAKLISDYRELDDLMDDKEKYEKAKKLYQKHKFLKTS